MAPAEENVCKIRIVMLDWNVLLRVRRIVEARLVGLCRIGRSVLLLLLLLLLLLMRLMRRWKKVEGRRRECRFFIILWGSRRLGGLGGR